MRFSKDNWESTYFNRFWMSWNWPSYSRECLLYWLHIHLVVKTYSLTVKKPQSALQYYLSWMWRHIGTQHWNWSKLSTIYENLHASGSTLQNTVNTSHTSQHRTNGPLRSTSWMYWGHSDIGPCGCQRGIQSHCIMLSQCTITCSIIRMTLCELW